MSEAAAPAARPVLVLNAGSSTLKFALIDVTTGSRRISGAAERLGTADARLRLERAGDDPQDRAIPDAEHGEVVAAVLDIAEQRPSGPGSGNEADLVGVGHRVVHGGERFSESVVIDDDVVAAITEYSRLAPLHNPAALNGIEAARRALPDVVSVAVFDTAFHQTMPPRAYRYAVPEAWYTRYGVRRYGFHGTSHRFVSAQAARLLGRPAEELGLVVAHLGNGCSAAAILGGKSVDTTMGLTPLEGLMMGTRSGDLDPGVFGYLAHEAGLSVDALTSTLNKESGLLGVSGRSNDMRAVQQAADQGDERALLAIEIFVHRLAKALAALVVSLDRLDAVVFTGGIGEHNALVRGRVVESLGFLGLSLDSRANDEHGRSTGGRISEPGRPVALVVPTDEELLIAQDTARLVVARRTGR